MVVDRSYLYWSYYELRSEQGSFGTVGWSVAVVSLLLGISLKLLDGKAQTYAQSSYSTPCTWYFVVAVQFITSLLFNIDRSLTLSFIYPIDPCR